MHSKYYTGVSVSGLFIWLTVLSSIWFVYIYGYFVEYLVCLYGCFVEFRVSCLLVQILISHPYLYVIGFLLLQLVIYTIIPGPGHLQL